MITPKALNMGFCVGLSGDTVIAGARLEDNGGADSGAAYIFVRTNGVWSQQAYLKAGTVAAGSQFGYSVAIDGDTAIVGVPLESGYTYNTGAAYVFVRTNGVWSQQAFLRASNKASDDRFGYSVAISGDRVILGAVFKDGPGGNAGAAYIFVRNDGVWTEEAYLKASNPGGDDRFGIGVAIDGACIAAGADYEDGGAVVVDGESNENASNAGAVYTFDLLEWAPGLKILSASLSHSGATESAAITFRSLPQRSYTLQRCDDLQVGSWADVPEHVNVPGTGGRITLQHESTASSQFYRLKESKTP